jgi:hypothetical protein
MGFNSYLYNRKEIKDNSTNWPLFLLFLLTTYLGYLMIDIFEALGVTIMIISFIGIFIDFYKDWGKKEEEGKYAGDISITSDHFILGKEKFETSEIKDLKIEISYIKGYKHWYHYGYTVDSGTRSSLEFTINGVRKQYNFQIFSNKQISDLKLVLLGLYEKGIFVKEFYLGERTYLLENLSYEEIQDFKKRYKF